MKKIIKQYVDETLANAFVVSFFISLSQFIGSKYGFLIQLTLFLINFICVLGLNFLIIYNKHIFKIFMKNKFRSFLDPKFKINPFLEWLKVVNKLLINNDYVIVMCLLSNKLFFSYHEYDPFLHFFYVLTKNFIFLCK